MSMRLAVPIAFTLASSADAVPPGVTAFQRQLLDSTMAPASAASDAAGTELIKVFASSDFKEYLRGLGTKKADALAASEPEAILDELKDNFAVVEYTTNCNADIVLEDWSEHGWYLSSWQYCVLAGHGCPQELYDIAETTLYKLKPFVNPGHPASMEEANERGRYVFKNMHRFDIGGDWNFGSTVLIYRQNVIRDRSIQVVGDSGQWVMSCIQQKSKPAGYDCSGMRTSQGRLGADLHEFYGQAVENHGSRQRSLEGEVAENIWHLLDPEATSNQVLDDPETIILGSVTPDDMKAISASFGAMFGTSGGDKLVAACQKYKIPLVWHFGDGSTQSKEPWNWTPDQPFVCGRPRLVDPSAVDAMSSGASISQEQQQIWHSVEQEARAYRANGANPTDEQISRWFKRVVAAQTGVAPLRTSSTCDVDLCFGMRVSTGDCACRKDPSLSPVRAPTQAPTTPTTTQPSASAGKCCYSGCSNCNEPGTWCARSRDSCEGSCSGQWCPSAASIFV